MGFIFFLFLLKFPDLSEGKYNRVACIELTLLCFSQRSARETEMATPKKSTSTKKRSATKAGGSRSAKAGLIFPVGRIGSLLRRGQYARRVGASSAVYLAAVLEYLTAELLELSAKVVVQQNKGKRVTPRAVTLAVRHDADLGTLLKDVTLSRGGVLPAVNKALAKKKGSKKSSATPSA